VGASEPLVQRGTTPQGLLALVAAGVGVTRLTLSSRSLRDGGVRVVPLAEDEAFVALAWRPDAPTPALPALREVVHEIARTIDSASLR
jgi:DNA-binding transcriptional LysR family regulator